MSGPKVLLTMFSLTALFVFIPNLAQALVQDEPKPTDIVPEVTDPKVSNINALGELVDSRIEILILMLEYRKLELEPDQEGYLEAINGWINGLSELQSGDMGRKEIDDLIVMFQGQGEALHSLGMVDGDGKKAVESTISVLKRLRYFKFSPPAGGEDKK